MISQYLGGFEQVGAASMEQSTKKMCTVEARIGGCIDDFNVFY